VNRFGLHTRPAGMFARMTDQFHSKVVVAKDAAEADGKSAMALMSLVATKGAMLHIPVEEADAREAMCEIEPLIQSRFHED
jgi:phosphocarrier protein HPr